MNETEAKAKLKEQIKEMAAMQHKLNELVDPQWLSSGHAWMRAMCHEALELQEHIGWKWWKKQKPDVAQARIELVDMWHFILSQYISVSYNDLKSRADHGTIIFMQGTYEDTADAVLGGVFEPDDSMYTVLHRPMMPAQMDSHELVDAIVGLGCFGYVFPKAFHELLKRLDMTWDDLYRMYVAKNVLNTFRQDNGYKQGTYIKTWDGAEDNVWLEGYMKEHADVNAAQLEAALKLKYASVREAA